MDQKVSRVSRKDAMNRKNPCGLLLITQTPGLLLSPKNNQRDFLENVCETYTLSQGSLLVPVPDEVSSDLSSIWTCYILLCGNDVLLWYSKKRSSFLWGIAEVASLSAFTRSTKIKRYMVCFCRPALLFNLGEIQNGTSNRAEQILRYMKRYETT